MKRSKLNAVLIFMSLLASPESDFTPLFPVIDRPGNTLNSSPFSYEYQYKTRNNYNDYNEFKSGRQANFHNVPRRPGVRDCYRWDRNSVRCD